MRRLVLSTVALLAALVSGPNLFAKGPSEGLTVTQWVQPEQVGEFRARVVVPAENGRTFAVEQARVTLLGVDGKVFRGVTNHRGEVTLSGVTPGVYAMTASGRKSFACYAMYVQDPDQTPGHALPAVAEIPCALVELDQFKSTTMPYMSSSAKRQNLKLGQTEQAGRLVKTQVSQVFRSPGDLVGHVIASPEIPASKTNVMLMRYGGKVRRSVSDDSGRFEFSEVEPGLYSLLAVGPHGIAAVGFEVVEQTRELSLNHSEGARFVSLMQETPEELNVLVAPVTQDELEDADEDG
ncbi:MAG: carboxypeptidase-like regulatory domain-containing protein, partial [Pirellulales bacterium]|nr:carboxypeptidase-like regulatory domain-containing protein [Pirellulales bacterium]